MIEKDPSTYPLITYIWVLLLACWGGIVGYLRKRRMGIIKRFSVTEFVGEVVTAAFAGMITFFLCEAAQLNPMVSAAMIGVSGHMGSRAVFLFEDWLQRRFGGVEQWRDR